MSTVRVDNVSKSFGTVRVLQDISIDIADGEFVVLVGPSGCGKSTLLRMIAGLEEVWDGDILIGERIVNDVPPKDRDIAMVFQSYALYPHMSVAGNMAFALKRKRVDKGEIETRANRTAFILGLEDLLQRYPRQLSGGQRQRVAMGRAIIRDPQVFLFDEPLSNLDAKLRVQMRTEIKKLHQRLRTTTVYVTHDQVEAMTLADKIIVMRDGIIEQVGAPLELYDRPVNSFVAQFIGSPSMNLINGTLEGGGFKTTDGVPLPLPPANSAPAGTKALYGIRPEHMTVGEGGVEAIVQVIEPTGAAIEIIAKIGEQTVSAVVRERVQANPGDEIRLKPDVENIHLFAAEGGRRL